MRIDERFKKGIKLFNQGKFYECHEVIEKLWRESTGPYRDLYKGVIQAAVALYHLKHGNRNGATEVYRSSVTYLEKFTPKALGLDVEKLVSDLNDYFGGKNKTVPKLDFAE